MAELGDLDLARFGASFQSFMEAVQAAAAPRESPLVNRLREHLGIDVATLPVITEEYDPFDHPNVQLAVDDYLHGAGRESELIGIAGESKRYANAGLSDFLTWNSRMVALGEGPVDYVNFHLAGDEILACVDFGLYLVREGGSRLVALLAGPVLHTNRSKVRLEVVARDPEHAQRFIAAITEGTQRLNVYRGHVIALSPGEFGPGRSTLIAFRTLPEVSRDGVILPESILDRIERHTIRFSEHAAQLVESGRSLKRGLLLYGPPGVGKTLTIEYLAGSMPGRTVLLTAGVGFGMLDPVVQIARNLAPSIVVLEDIDLIAEQRGMPMGHAGPLLFQLLNEMDGLQRDVDVIFVLTTNRPEVLETALAARPGRIDLAVELPLPDREARLRLLELYARGLDLVDVDLGAVADQIEGATPAYIKELLRKAAVVAAIEGDGTAVTAAHLAAALTELNEGGRLARRLLGFRGPEDDGGSGVPESVSRSGWAPGFPAGSPTSPIVSRQP
jgi:DNA polymerase III delta prime subunit